MSQGELDIDLDTLFVGMTRPTTYWGVPLYAFLVEFMTTVIVFLGTGNPLYLSVAVPIHGILYAVSSNDPGIFQVMSVWVISAGRANGNARFWGAVSFSPLSVKKWKR